MSCLRTHRALARLADCVHVVLAAAAGDAGKLDGREAVDAGSHSQVDISNEPPLWAVMSTVQSCVPPARELMAGRVWRLARSRGAAPPDALAPSDSVEALLRAPPTMQESLLPASTAGANTGSGISCGASCGGGGSSSSAGFNDGSSGRGGSCVSALGSLSIRLSAHAALLLRQIQLCERVRVQSPAGSPCWVLAIRAQRHGVAALGALMETVPEAHVLVQQPEGIRVVLECLSSSSQRSGDEALPPRQLRLMLQLQMQCAMIALQAASVSHHEAWMRQWREAAGSRSLARLLRWVCSRSIWADSEPGCSSAVGDPTSSDADSLVSHDDASAPSRMSGAAHRPSVLMDSRTAADMLLARVSRDVAVWGAGLSAAQLGEWCENLLPPVTHSSESALPLAAGVGSSAARAAAAAGSECAAEVQLVFGFFRSISDYSAARETLLAAILCAFLPSSGVDAEAAEEARDQRDAMGNDTGKIGEVGADDLADLASGWQHELLRLLRDRGTAWILPSSRLAPLAARLLCGERFLMRHNKSAASHEVGAGRLGVQVVSSHVGVSDSEVMPPPLLASTTILSPDGELITAWRGSGDAAVPVSLPPWPSFCLHHLWAVVSSPLLVFDGAAACAVQLLDAACALLLELREERGRREAARREAREEAREEAGEEAREEAGEEAGRAAPSADWHKLRGLCVCLSDLLAARRAPDASSSKLPSVTSTLLPESWRAVLRRFACLLRELTICRPYLVEEERLCLDGLVSLACEQAMAIPDLTRW